MKDQITVSLLLKRYKTWVKRGDIRFLGEDSRKEVVDCIDELMRIMAPAQKNSKDFKWHEAHKNGIILWHKLASNALRNIQSTSKGNSTLFNFLTAATEFEDLLYGLEPYYRDHTLHSLWVYLIGEYILRYQLKKDQLGEIHGDLNWYLINDIRKDGDRYSYPPILVKYSEYKEKVLIKGIDGVLKNRDAIWCIVALCHDLGYSLAKLTALNDKVKAVLNFFELSNLKPVGYSLDIEHQYLISQFLELMAMDVRIVPGDNYEELKNLEIAREDEGLEQLETPEFIKKLEELEKEQPAKEFIKKLEEKTLIKCYRDDSTYWRLCRALEQKRHGILSAYLIYKILSIFSEASVRGPAEEWGLDDDEAIENIIRGDILFAIAQHEFDFAYLFDFSSLADILILADELEEFSRFGRPLQSREYYPTMADSKINFEKAGKDEKDIVIRIIYEVAEHCNLIDFFLKKAERLCRIYSLNEEGEENVSYRRIVEISMTVTKKMKRCSLGIELNRDPSKAKVHLPEFKTSDDTSKNGKNDFNFTLYDDRICIRDNEEPMSLIEWFKKFEKDEVRRRVKTGWIKEEIEKWIELPNELKELMYL